MFGWLRNRTRASSSLVVTGPGVIKVHNVECRFRGAANSYGKLSQDRWSDGQERFRLKLRNLPAGEASVQLMRHGMLVGEFEVSGGRVRFVKVVKADEAVPKFEIGETLTIEAGRLTLTGIVEAD